MDKDMANLRSAPPRRLASLFDETLGISSPWTREEFGAILKHQLSAVILPDVSHLRTDLGREAQDPTLNPNTTFCEALGAVPPSMKLLHVIKNISKARAAHKESGIPREVSLVVYYSAIAAAINHGEKSITTLSRETLSDGLHWVLDQEWVEETVKAPMRRALLASDTIEPLSNSD